MYQSYRNVEVNCYLVAVVRCRTADVRESHTGVRRRNTASPNKTQICYRANEKGVVALRMVRYLRVRDISMKSPLNGEETIYAIIAFEKHS